MKKYITFFLLLIGIHAAMAGPIEGAHAQIIVLDGYGNVHIEEQWAILEGAGQNIGQTNSTMPSMSEEYQDELKEKKPETSFPSTQQEDIEDDSTIEEENEANREVLFYDHGPVIIRLDTGESFEFTELVPIDEIWNIEPDFGDPTTYVLAALQAMEELLKRIYMIEFQLNENGFNDTEFGHVFRSIHQANYAAQPYWSYMLESYRGCLYELIRSTLRRLESLAFKQWVEKLERSFQTASDMRFIRRLNGSDAVLENLRLIDPNDLQKVLNAITMVRQLIDQRPYIAQSGGPNKPPSPLLARLQALEGKVSSLAMELQRVEDPIYTLDPSTENNVSGHWLFEAIQEFYQKLAQFDPSANQRVRYYHQCTTKQLRPMLRRALSVFLNEYIRFRHSNIDDLPANGHPHEQHLSEMLFTLNAHFMDLLLLQQQAVHNNGSNGNDTDTPPKKKKPTTVNGKPVYMSATK
ncbi:MAG: hypothetical protein Tsb0018_04980 [Opitutales bacterium]